MDGRIRSKSRLRNREGTFVRTQFGVTTSGTDGTLGMTVERHMCTDSVNEKQKDNPLEITHLGNLFVPIYGHRESAGFSCTLEDFVPPIVDTVYTHDAVLAASIPSVGTVALATIARSNPSRPAISVPNFLYELKDLPDMIRDIGHLKLQAANFRKKGFQRIHPKNAASHLLSYQMGWSPLIGDLRKLLDFQALVDKKMRELQNLYSNGGLQRRVRSSEWKGSSVSSTPFTYISAIDGALTCKRTKWSTIERWGTVRWLPTALPDPRFSQKDLGKLARDLTFGMKGISAKQIWDAIPWTWLVSWFSNVDDFLEAHNNQIPLTHSKPCIMTHEVAKFSYTRTDAYTREYQGGYGDVGIERKRRTTSNGSLSASIPFLNARQLSILGALAIQRKR